MANSTVYISYFDGIDHLKVNKLIQIIQETIEKHKPKEIYFLFSSWGGNIISGFTLYNHLISLKGKIKITMHNVGTVNSIATLIFSSGDIRLSSPTATFLFHGATYNFGNTDNTLFKIHEVASMMESWETLWIDALCKASTITKEEMQKQFIQGTQKKPDFALEKKYIHSIEHASIPPDAMHLTVST